MNQRMQRWAIATVSSLMLVACSPPSDDTTSSNSAASTVDASTSRPVTTTAPTATTIPATTAAAEVTGPMFSEFATVAEGVKGDAPALVDVNGDGRLDIVIVPGGTSTFNVVLNLDGTGGEPSFRDLPANPVGRPEDDVNNVPTGLGMHDFNDDGLMDLYLTNQGTGKPGAPRSASADSARRHLRIRPGAGERPSGQPQPQHLPRRHQQRRRHVRTGARHQRGRRRQHSRGGVRRLRRRR